MSDSLPMVNYVIPSWGNRAQDSHAQKVEDLTLYQNLDNLSTIQTKTIQQITIGYPKCDNPLPAYNSLMQDLCQRDSIHDIPLSIMHTDNYGHSYGQLLLTMQKYANDFDYHIFAEDDYLPIVNYFDQILIDLIEHHDGCGYLCACILPEEVRFGRHVGISNGIFSHKYCKGMLDYLGENGISKIFSPLGGGPKFQLQFSRFAFQHIDILMDYARYYKSRFRGANGKIYTYGNIMMPDIFMPIELIRDPDMPTIDAVHHTHRHVSSWDW